MVALKLFVCLVQQLLVLVAVMQFYELLSAQPRIADIPQCGMGASKNCRHKNVAYARICGGPIKTNLTTTIRLLINAVLCSTLATEIM